MFRCKSCNKTFSSKYSLTRHIDNKICNKEKIVKIIGHIRLLFEFGVSKTSEKEVKTKNPWWKSKRYNYKTEKIVTC